MRDQCRGRENDRYAIGRRQRQAGLGLLEAQPYHLADRLLHHDRGDDAVASFLPLYVEELGVNDHAAIVQWSGIAYGATFFAAALVAPLWGGSAIYTAAS